MRTLPAVILIASCQPLAVRASQPSCPEIRLLSTATNAPLHGASVMTLLVARLGGEFIQWYKDGQPLQDDLIRVQGAKEGALFISPFTPRDQGLYHVVISDSCGTWVASDPEPIRIACVADINGDDLIDDNDFSLFVKHFGISDCPSESPCVFADLTADGNVDDADFVVFASQYNHLICARP